MAEANAVAGRSAERTARDGRAPKSYYRHMSPMAAKAMRELYFVGRLKQHEIGKMFGLRQGSVSRVISEQVWA